MQVFIHFKLLQLVSQVFNWNWNNETSRCVYIMMFLKEFTHLFAFIVVIDIELWPFERFWKDLWFLLNFAFFIILNKALGIVHFSRINNGLRLPVRMRTEQFQDVDKSIMNQRFEFLLGHNLIDAQNEVLIAEVRQVLWVKGLSKQADIVSIIKYLSRRVGRWSSSVCFFRVHFGVLLFRGDVLLLHLHLRYISKYYII